MSTLWASSAAGLRISSIPLTALAAPRVLWTRQAWLLGWNLTAAAPATPAVVTLTDGDLADGDLIGILRIAADATNSRVGGAPSWPIETCLTIDPGATPISGAVLIGEPWNPPATRS